METLVLDIGYQPISRIRWTRAAVLAIIKKRAEIVEEYPDRYINGADWQIKAPSIIRLLVHVGKRKAVKFSRHGIYARDRGRCQYCGTHVSRHSFQYEHVIPKSQGGKTCWENIVVSCMPCNQRKAGRTPAQASMRLLSTPVRPKKLPDAGEHGMAYNPGMPENWKQYLLSHAYWNAPLEEEE